LAKATLSFLLPDEAEEFSAALQGGRARLVLWLFDQYLRNRVKHEELEPAVHDAIEQARAELHSMLAENRVSLDE
jgi:hypothetical protein